MLKHALLTFSLLSVVLSCTAQVPYYTVLDTAQMREMREKNIHFHYYIDQPYDSVKGTLKKKAKPDTMYNEYYRMGREVCFSYLNEDRTRAYMRIFVNDKGQVVRRFSYDTDSTNGFLDYWVYNEKGQVANEVSLTREGSREEAFSSADFVYNDSGKLVKKRSYMSDDNNEPELRSYVDYYYNGNLDIEISFDEHGDTTYIDTTGNLHTDLAYWSRRYRYMEKDNGTMRKMLVSETVSHYDTINGIVREIYSYQRYDYSTGKPEELSIDTGYYDLKGNVQEYRDGRYIQKYFYDAKGELQYMICYNRRMQPLYRRTEVYTYFGK